MLHVRAARHLLLRDRVEVRAYYQTKCFAQMQPAGPKEFRVRRGKKDRFPKGGHHQDSLSLQAALVVRHDEQTRQIVNVLYVLFLQR